MTYFGQIIARMPRDFELGAGLSSYRRDVYLDKQSVEDILKNGYIQSIVADVGHPLFLVDTEKCRKFYKEEVAKHLANPSKIYRLEDFPDEYFYTASQWVGNHVRPIILLEKSH